MLLSPFYLRNEWNRIVLESRIDEFVVIVRNVEFVSRDVINIDVRRIKGFDFVIMAFLFRILWDYRFSGIRGDDLLDWAGFGIHLHWQCAKVATQDSHLVFMIAESEMLYIYG